MDTFKAESDLNDHQRTHSAREYIHNNFHNEIRVKTLARLSYMSAYHFSRVFKQENGCSPGQYILRYRIAEAKRLLIETPLRVQDVSCRSGFGNCAYFIMRFRQSVGKTPGKFRDAEADKEIE